MADVGGRVRIKSTLNPVLWLCAIVTVPVASPHLSRSPLLIVCLVVLASLPLALPASGSAHRCFATPTSYNPRNIKSASGAAANDRATFRQALAAAARQEAALAAPSRRGVDRRHPRHRGLARRLRLSRQRHSRRQRERQIHGVVRGRLRLQSAGRWRTGFRAIHAVSGLPPQRWRPPRRPVGNNPSSSSTPRRTAAALCAGGGRRLGAGASSAAKARNSQSAPSTCARSAT